MKKKSALDSSLLPFFTGGEVESTWFFRVNGTESPETVRAPEFIIRRLYHLGKAYEIHPLYCFQPGVKQVLGSRDVPALMAGLRKLRTLINDEEAHTYIDRLLCDLEAPPGPDCKSVVVSASSEKVPR